MTDREQFEASDPFRLVCLAKAERAEWLEEIDQYNTFLTQMMWEAWQAARAAPAQDVTATEWNEMRDAMENCRLYAARHRKEEWARTILDFCKEGGVTGSPLRAAPAQPFPPENTYDPPRPQDANYRPAQPAGEK